MSWVPCNRFFSLLLFYGAPATAQQFRLISRFNSINVFNPLVNWLVFAELDSSAFGFQLCQVALERFKIWRCSKNSQPLRAAIECWWHRICVRLQQFHYLFVFTWKAQAENPQFPESPLGSEARWGKMFLGTLSVVQSFVGLICISSFE